MRTSTRQLHTATNVVLHTLSAKGNDERHTQAAVSGASDAFASSHDPARTLAGGIWFVVMLCVVFGSAIYSWQCLYGALLRISITELMNCI